MTETETQLQAQQSLIEGVLEALEAERPEPVLASLLEKRTAAEVALMLEALPPESRKHAWEAMAVGTRADTLERLPETVREQLIDGMSPTDLAATVEEMDVDRVVTIADELPEEVASPVFANLDEKRQRRLQAALSYAPGTAARLMHTDVLSVQPDFTLKETLDYLQDFEPPRHTDGIMVCDSRDNYLGKLYYTDLVHYPPKILVGDVMVNDVDTVEAEMSESDLAALFEKHNLISAAVLDQGGKFVGRITSADVMPLIHREAEKAFLQTSGLSQDEDLFAPVGPSARRRAVWLAINLATAFLAAWVIGLFEETLSQVVALAVLMPVVASMGGIAGSQTLTLTIRGFALGQISSGNVGWLTYKELAVSVLNGLLWALVVAVIAAMWFNDLEIGYVIAVALVLTMICAALAGVGVPLVLKRCGVDPALAGAVVLTTVTDVVGFFSFLGLGTLLLI